MKRTICASPAGAAARLALLCLAATCAWAAEPTPTPGLFNENSTSTTEASDIRRFDLPSGGISALSYTITHVAKTQMDPGKFFPGARIDRTLFPTQLDGNYADGGWQSAWLAPLGKNMFYPQASLIENVYFSNRLFSLSGDVIPLNAGDRCQLAMTHVPADTPQPWDRARTASSGTMQWDTGKDTVRRVASTYGQTTGGMDVLFVRADIVARGGDVDARSGEVPLPPLVVDLPAIYPDQALAAFQAGIFFPAAQYVKTFRGEVLPQTGKAVFVATVRGYFPEAKEYKLPSGADINEWHISIYITITLTGTPVPLQARTAAQMPEGGVAFFGQGGTVQQLNVDPGGTVMGGVGLEPMVITPQNSSSAMPPALSENRDGLAKSENAGITRSSQSQIDGATPTSESSSQTSTSAEPSRAILIDELKAAAPINKNLASPVDLLTGNRNYALTLDPDYRGEGVLALRALRRATTGTPYLNALAVPYAIVDHTPIKLDRSRLVDLRVTPTFDSVRVTFTGGDNSFTEPISYYRRRLGIAPAAGLVVNATYDVGGGRYAFLTIGGLPEGDQPGTIRSELNVISLSRETFESSAVQYLELATSGPVTYNGETKATEFSAPLDQLGANKNILAGNYSITGTIDGRRSDGSRSDGMATVVRAPGALVPNPVPNSQASIEGQPLALYYSAPTDVPPYFTSVSFVATTLVSDGPVPTPDPKPIGTICEPAQVVDSSTSDAPPTFDIRRGWFDADDANIYAMIELAELPSSAEPGTGTTMYLFPFRYEHVGYAAAAILDEAGQWSFEFGYQGNSTSAYGKIADVSGEVKPGAPGYVRIAIPRNLELTGYHNGEYLRDTSVLSFSGTTNQDLAPQETTASYGVGGDYVVGAPCGLVLPTSVVSRKAHGAAGNFDVDLPLVGHAGIECRSGGANKDYEIVFTFPSPVTFSSANATPGPGGTGSVSSTSRSGDGMQIIVNLTNVSNAQKVRVTLVGVNDGQNSDDVAVPMAVLVGDTNADRSVNSADIGQTKSQSGHTVTTSNFREDVTADGSINSADIGLVKSKSGTALPSLP